MGQKSFSFIGLSILGTEQTFATSQLSGNISLLIDELIIFTIEEASFSETGLMNFTGILSKPFEQSFLSFDINLFTLAKKVCFMKNVLSDSCSGIIVSSFVWSNPALFLFVNLDANSVKYRLRLSEFWLIHLVDQVYSEMVY